MPAPFLVDSNATNLTVWQVDDSGNVRAAGTTQTTGLILPAGAAPAPSPGALVLYSPDGSTITGPAGFTPPADTPFTVGGVQVPASEFWPSDFGFAAWTYDQALAFGQSATTNGSLYLNLVIVRATRTVSTVSISIGGAAVSPVANQNYLGIYDSTGLRVASTAAGALDAGTTSLGLLPQALSAPVTLRPGRYWVAVLLNAATPAQIARATAFQTLPNAGTSTAGMRFAVNGTGLTSLPASITPASNTNNANITTWAALS